MKQTIYSVLALCWFFAGGVRGMETNAPVQALQLDEVLASVNQRYPPLLGALIERDLAAGRLKSAQGGFDHQLFGKGFWNPTGFYQYETLDVGFEQPTPFWGSTFFGGYKITRGSLPDYYDKERTQRDGEIRAGARVPLLRDGSIDRRRAGIQQARLDLEIADPLIQRQHLDIIRGASIAYYNWLAAGLRLVLAEQLLQIAEQRDIALRDQAERGLIAKIVRDDNERLLVSRRLALVQSQRRLDQAAISLSLFLRNYADEPIRPPRTRLPMGFEEMDAPNPERLAADMQLAYQRRPELRRIELQIRRTEVDAQLARNQRRPNLDASVTAAKDFGSEIYKDKGELEVVAGLEFKMPLQRREAQGRLEAAEAQIQRLRFDEQFARDRIATDVRDAFSAWETAYSLIRETRRNIDLSQLLAEAEQARFRQGASDLLAVQIREQAAFDAQVLSVEALADYFRARAEYRAAAALDYRVREREK